MPYKNKEDANAAARKRYAEDATVRERHKKAQDNWEAKNREDRNEYRAGWAKNDRDLNREKYRHKEHIRDTEKYGVSEEWYRDKLIAQCGVCALCKHLNHVGNSMQRLTIDHNHECCNIKTKSCGKCVRGLLCSACNFRLSYLENILKEALVTPFPQLIGKPEPWTGRAMRYLKKYAITTQENQ